MRFSPYFLLSEWKLWLAGNGAMEWNRNTYRKWYFLLTRRTFHDTRFRFIQCKTHLFPPQPLEKSSLKSSFWFNHNIKCLMHAAYGTKHIIHHITLTCTVSCRVRARARVSDVHVHAALTLNVLFYKNISILWQYKRRASKSEGTTVEETRTESRRMGKSAHNEVAALGIIGKSCNYITPPRTHQHNR